jgi:hypothetical protein
MRAPNIQARMPADLKEGSLMRSVAMLAAVLAVSVLAVPALAFDVQNGGASGTGGANLAPDVGVATPGVSIDTDLKAQLGLPDDRTTAGTATKSGLQFGGGVFTGGGSGFNTTTMGYDERPWVAPRTRPGRD